MIPLKVSCFVETPIVYDGMGMPFDGILAYASYAGLSRLKRESLPAPSLVSFPLDLPIPIEKAQVGKVQGVDHRLLDDEGELWVYRASNVHAEWVGRSKHWVRKKADTKAMTRWSKDGVANISLGPLKNGNASFNAMWPKDGKLTWHVVGDPVEIARMLRLVIGLGKFRNHGMGRLRKNPEGDPWWFVEVADKDYSMVDVNGNVARAIPVPEHHTGPSRMLSIRPPYHHPSRRARCYLLGLPK